MKMMEQVVIGTSSDEEDIGSSQLVFSLKQELKTLPPLSSGCCIYRTPERLRKQNEQAYMPHVVSIGPYHHNKKEAYANMEVVKRRCLQKFLDQTGMSLEYAVGFIKERELRIRNSYDQIIDLSSDKFVRMVLLDAVFAFTFICAGPEELRIENDRVFGSSPEETVIDMLLLENQLPFFILVDLSELVLKDGVFTEVAKQSTSIYIHFYETFIDYIKGKNIPIDIESSDIKHLVDLQRRCLLPSLSLSTTNKYNYEQVVPTATELHEVGIKLKIASDTNSLLDVQFTNGVLKIPCIYVDFRTETLFRNVLAFEQCHCDDRYVTEYIYFMDSLINTQKDVELLVRCKILVNNLGDNEAVSTLFNNLGKGLTSDADNYYFGTLFKDLIAYRNYPLHKWMAILRHDYFKTPWKILSIIVAFIIILLTLIQTMFSILTYYNADNAHA